ncbi:hypothetical protein P4571_06750 [Niallia alba]|uniref:GAF domain-containing protein n=1 Tax=Niallia alba TaxID=2729105 RepID=UPI002E1FC269|nr:hypothetical protein [Niallia alba]
MSDLLKVLLDKQPNWFFTISSLLLIAILVIIAIWVYKGAKNYATSVNKENRLIELLEERNVLQREKDKQAGINEQIAVVLENSSNFINSLNNYNLSDTSNMNQGVQTVIESLATDIKSVVGEKHRCGCWLVDPNTDYLTLFNGSSAFPSEQIMQKKLSINHSIAGRSYRKKETIHIDNVNNDPDWSLTDNPSSYSSLICIPIGTWGVITIDGKQNMSHNTVLIGKLYASIIEGYMNKFFYNEVTNIVTSEAAYSNED